MSAAARPPEGGAFSRGEMSAQRTEGRPACAAARPPEGGASDRLPLVDAVKAIACVAIVLHHLAFYGPMSDVAYPLMPALIDWLYHYGRMAVMAFFVVTGFLTAAAFAPTGVSCLAEPWPAIRRRYLRLALPMLAAMVLVIAVYALVRPWLRHESVSGPTSAPQLLAHVLLNHELLDQEALSAGVWYVAMDFQLFVFVALLLWLSHALGQRWPVLRWLGAGAIVLLTAASLFLFNRDDAWDETAFYFFCYYGLGCLAWWLTDRRNGWGWLLVVTIVVGIALAIDFRWRVVVALATMWLLGAARQGGWLVTTKMPAPVMRLAQVSYSVFLVHFPLGLLVSATVVHFFARDAVANVLGMIVSFVVSLAGGVLFYRWIESRASDSRMRFGILAAYGVAGGLGMLA